MTSRRHMNKTSQVHALPTDLNLMGGLKQFTNAICVVFFPLTAFPFLFKSILPIH